jgi:prophage DNA circulation protein
MCGAYSGGLVYGVHMAPKIDPLAAMKDLQQRADFILNADKHMAEVVGLLKETRRTLENLNDVVTKFVKIADDVERRVGGVANVVLRLDRLEEAALNIERATNGVENAMLALPRALRDRITKRAQGPGPSDP